MSQQTVEIVRNLYEAINRLGAASLLELPDAARRDFFRRSFDPELEIRQIPGLVDTAGTFRGYDGFLQATRELVEVLNGIRFELGKEYARGDSDVANETRSLLALGLIRDVHRIAAILIASMALGDEAESVVCLGDDAHLRFPDGRLQEVEL